MLSIAAWIRALVGVDESKHLQMPPQHMKKKVKKRIFWHCKRKNSRRQWWWQNLKFKLIVLLHVVAWFLVHRKKFIPIFLPKKTHTQQRIEGKFHFVK